MPLDFAIGAAVAMANLLSNLLDASGFRETVAKRCLSTVLCMFASNPYHARMSLVRTLGRTLWKIIPLHVSYSHALELRTEDWPDDFVFKVLVPKAPQPEPPQKMRQQETCRG